MTSLRNLQLLLILPLLAISISSCDENNPFKVDYSSAPEPFNIDNATKVESETGLIYYIIEEGAGFEVDNSRDRVAIYYTGRRLESGQIFDSSYRNGSQFPSNLRLSELIPGFQEGLIGMKEGGKRVLIIPPDLAYGNSPNSNLKNDTLRFDVELDEVLSN